MTTFADTCHKIHYISEYDKKKLCLLWLTDYFNILHVLSQRYVWNKENTRRQLRFTFTSTAILNTISPIYIDAVSVGGSFQ